MNRPGTTRWIAPGVRLNMPPDVRGTAIQQRVWQALREIPAGETVGYGDIARRPGAPKSVRAVAQACATSSWPWPFRVTGLYLTAARWPAIAMGGGAQAHASGKRVGRG
jgi:hypothetical protein